MNAERLLEHAARVLAERRERYGDPQPLFEQVARRWSLTLGTTITPAQVALCLIDLKMARLARKPADLDSLTDVAGYAACLWEILR